MLKRPFFAPLLSLLLLGSAIAADNQSPNILFIAIDDMNDWTGFLGGHPQAITPNMDKLAEKGVVFTNAHCVSPACSPSRNALLFGVEPFNSGLYPFYNYDEIPDEVLAPYTSLPQFFKESGYGVYGAGKIHHGSKANPVEWTDYHEPRSVKLNYKPEAGYQQGNSTKMAFCPTTNPLEDHPDHQVASYGVDILSRQHDKPFFLAVGIVKPHLAFVCPEQFFDLYPETVAAPKIKADDHSDIPWAGRAMAKINDDSRYRNDKAWNAVRRAYLACISWADYNIGRVLYALEASPYARNTIVILWSDHGYAFGEKRHHRKFALWEETTRVPFIIWDARDRQSPRGRTCSEAVSLINVYRTATDLAGLAPPAYVNGVSLTPQLKAPDTPIAQPAITTWGRGNYGLRDEEWRYIRYFDGSEELYSHKNDPNEWTNLASHPEYASIKQRFAAHLPKKEAPLVREGISLWNIVDADKPDLKKTKETWSKINQTIEPPLGD